MKRFKDILCVVEPGKVCKPSLERAVALAENNQASLTVVAVAPRISADIGMSEGGPNSANLQGAAKQGLIEKLQAMVEPHRRRVKLDTKVLVGTPFLQIIRDVMRNGRDLVIKLPVQLDWLDRLFGSDDMHLLRKCPCPVWLIKPQAPKAYRRILAAVDVDDARPPEETETGRALNRQLLEMASSLALAESAELHIVHVWDAIGENAMRGVFMYTSEEKVVAYVEQTRQQHAVRLDALLRDVADGHAGDALAYLKPQKHLRKGWARKEIPALAKQIQADLVVMGTVARTGVPGFIMGNTAETILNQLDCSVLAIKPPGFVTPVTLD